MKISVHVHPNSKHQSVETIDDKTLQIHLQSPATENKANIELIKVVAKHFQVSKSAVILLRGAKSRDKILEVLLT